MFNFYLFLINFIFVVNNVIKNEYKKNIKKIHELYILYFNNCIHIKISIICIKETTINVPILKFNTT